MLLVYVYIIFYLEISITNSDNFKVLKIFKDKAQNVLYVDIVCDNGYTWVKVIARNAQSLHLIWAGIQFCLSYLQIYSKFLFNS